MLSLDLSFNVACEKCYALEMEHWIRRNYGKVVTVYHHHHLVKKKRG
jgi:hypothetical protein